MLAFCFYFLPESLSCFRIINFCKWAYNFFRDIGGVFPNILTGDSMSNLTVTMGTAYIELSFAIFTKAAETTQFVKFAFADLCQTDTD